MSLSLQRTTQNDAIGVRNTTGSTLLKGRPLYISGFDTATNRYLVDYADSTDDQKMAMLVLDSDLANNSNSTAYDNRLVTGIDTSGATAVGDHVHLGLGGTLVFGSSSNQFIGIVTIKHASTGAVRFIIGGGSGGGGGTSGFSGFSSMSGYSGYSAANGVSGFSGFSGVGTSGFSGTGLSGFSGTGASGFSGAEGTSGYSSLSGFSGFSGTGFSGPAGVSGFSGFSGEYDPVLDPFMLAMFG